VLRWIELLVLLLLYLCLNSFKTHASTTPLLEWVQAIRFLELVIHTSTREYRLCSWILLESVLRLSSSKVNFSIFCLTICERCISSLVLFSLAWYVTSTPVSVWNLATSHSCCHHWLSVFVMMTLVEHSCLIWSSGLYSLRLRLLLKSLKVAASRLTVKGGLRRERVVQTGIVKDLRLVPRLLFTISLATKLILLEVD
jgi:hypothetical protein